jgi:hypothetical protein
MASEFTKINRASVARMKQSGFGCRLLIDGKIFLALLLMMLTPPELHCALHLKSVVRKLLATSPTRPTHVQ